MNKEKKMQTRARVRLEMDKLIEYCMHTFVVLSWERSVIECDNNSFL